MTALVVTDHALCRYLERVMGLPIEDIRATIAATPGLAQAIAAGARHVSIDGLTYSFRDGNTLATIQGGRTPSAAIRGGYINGHGKAPKGADRSRFWGKGRNGGRHDRAFDGGE